MVESTFLNVLCGDAIILRFLGNHGKFVNILIDGGYVKTYQSVLKPQLCKIRDRTEKIDLLILTHCDNDHIGGILSFIRDKDFDHQTFVGEWWANFDVAIGSKEGNISAAQLMMFKDFLLGINQFTKNTYTNLSPSFKLFGAEIILLSPNTTGYTKAVNYIESVSNEISAFRDHLTPIDQLLADVDTEAEEDISITNGSSIAILVKVAAKNFLLLGDAYPSVVVDTLEKLGFNDTNRLNCEWIKIAHHGSKMNTSNALLACIDCDKFIFSVNGLNRSGLPNKETLVRILKKSFRFADQPLYFYFTHNDAMLPKIFASDREELITSLNFNILFPEKNKPLFIQTNY
ncbi:ComEC/Rec2 family competence protein [Pedobacter gandavensis]|uniref:MBL fold metallo-hydrolase n=1 Tax=Pedobacter gandavensis TaxID=2679963 RepID=A0ABR6F270_9SPHI|nr:MBL fold metallo-hydrolase [Pedobacter gandavensis]MBB2151637.1 MBL fold metallo-hydrolase [Pedobacter gandavensis]